MFYKNIYDNLCLKNKHRKKEWKKESNLHRHHIIPKHHNGKNNDDNYTYLTIREHIIAHFLLWKIYNNPNDLRSMNMLGACLTFKQRQQIGIFCRDNEIGFFAEKYKEKRKEWQKKGLQTQKNNIDDKNSFYYWSTKEGRKKRASMGGKKGGTIQKQNKIGFFNLENRKKWAKMGGESLKGMICVTNGTHRTRIKPEKLDEYMSKGYILGFKLFS